MASALEPFKFRICKLPFLLYLWKNRPPSQLQLEQVDLSSFESIRDFSKRVQESHGAINYLVNNAAVISAHYELSRDQQELQLAVNYLAPVLLTELLIPALKKSSNARIVNISSTTHHMGSLSKPDLHLVGNQYGPYRAYNQSKLALTMYTTQLSEHLKDTNITVLSMHPGSMPTNLTQNLNTFSSVSKKLFFSSGGGSDCWMCDLGFEGWRGTQSWETWLTFSFFLIWLFITIISG